MIETETSKCSVWCGGEDGSAFTNRDTAINHASSGCIYAWQGMSATSFWAFPRSGPNSGVGKRKETS